MLLRCTSINIKQFNILGNIIGHKEAETHWACYEEYVTEDLDQTDKTENIKALHYWPFVMGIHI